MAVKGYVSTIVVEGTGSLRDVIKGFGKTKVKARQACLELLRMYLQYFVDIGGGVYIPQKIQEDIPINMPEGCQLLVVERLQTNGQPYYWHFLALKPGDYIIAKKKVVVTMEDPVKLSVYGRVRHHLPSGTQEYLAGKWDYAESID